MTTVRSPWLSHISAHLEMRYLNPLFWTTFKRIGGQEIDSESESCPPEHGACVLTTLKGRWCLPPEQRAVMLTLQGNECGISYQREGQARSLTDIWVPETRVCSPVIKPPQEQVLPGLLRYPVELGACRTGTNVIMFWLILFLWVADHHSSLNWESVSSTHIHWSVES